MISPQKIFVFEQCASGESKIQGILAYGDGLFQLERFSIDEPLPTVVDDAVDFFPDGFKADLVLDYLKHPDLSYDLAGICRKRGIPVIASGKNIRTQGIYTPPT